MTKNKFILFIILTILLFFNTCLAIVRYSPDNIFEYKKYSALVEKYPENKNYHFEFAILLASMGKIEAASKEFNKINALDENYAKKIIGTLRLNSQKYPSWKNFFKLGFCNYFLFDDLNGRIELAERRIRRAEEKGDRQRIKEQKQIIIELAPAANYHYQQALIYLQKTADKKPVNYINAMALTYQAVIKSKVKAWPEALSLCEKALTIAPDAYSIRAAYMEALRQNGNLIAATGQMSAALKLKTEQEKYEKEIFGSVYPE